MNRREALKAFALKAFLSIGWLQEQERNARIAEILSRCRMVYSDGPVTCDGPTYVLDIDSD